MPISQEVLLISSWIASSISNLILNLGRGRMPGVVYDAAILGAISNELGFSRYPRQVQKVLSLQKNDGSWGASYFHPYDRLLSTASVLSMIVDLKLDRQPEIEAQFSDGVSWIMENQSKFFRSDYPLPVAFEFLYPKLIGNVLDKSSSLSVSISKLEVARTTKLDMLGNSVFNRMNPLFFSMEGIVEEKYQAEQLASFQTQDGSLFASPASTSIYLKYKVKSAIPSALRYINRQSLTPDHLCVHFDDYTYFNIAYSLYPLTKTDYTFSTQIYRPIKLLLSNWKSHGISYGYNFPILDADDTAVALLVLDHLGIGDPRNKLSALSPYEGKEAFKTYLIESDPALVTNAHVLEALLHIDPQNNDHAIEKIIQYFEKLGENVVKMSKYIASPIMQISNLIMAFLPSLPEFAEKYMHILRRELINVFEKQEVLETEEMAYAIISMLLCRKNEVSIDDGLVSLLFIQMLNSIDQAVNYRETFVWTSKVQYSPTQVNQAHILSAIALYHEVFGSIRVPIRNPGSSLGNSISR